MRVSKKIVPWGVSEFMNTGADYEIFHYLEQSSSPEATDPLLLDRVRFFVEDPRQGYLSEIIGYLTGKSDREWQLDDFALRPRRTKARDEWGDDGEVGDEPSPGSTNLLGLLNEFVGYMKREERVPFARGYLVRDHLYSYLLERHAGNFDPRPSMLDEALGRKTKIQKPPRPAHPLCPDRMTLDVFLGGLIQGLNAKYYAAAAVFQAMPAWLRFLESKRLIDADVRHKVANELLPLHDELSRCWQAYTDDGSLEKQQQVWPADAADRLSESLR